MKTVFYILGAMLSTACAQQTVVIQRVPFNPSEYSSLARTGTATVTGQAYIKTPDGHVHYPHKAQARLNPKTTYSQQWYEINYLGRQNIAIADPRYLAYVYMVDFGANGQFTFRNIPAGDYYLSAPIFWFDELSQPDGSILLKRRGAFICYEVHVEEGNTLVTNITAEQVADLALLN